MRIYQILAEHPDKGTCTLGWVRTEGQAKTAVKEIKKHVHSEVSEWEEIEYRPEDIPTDKAGLVLWLNKYSVFHGFLPILANIMNVDYDVQAIKDEWDVGETDFEEITDYV